MTFLPSVIRAEHRGAFRIRVVFNDGSENTIDLASWLEGPMFEPLKNVAFFKRLFVDGGTVVWPNGADIAPETLYEAAGRRRRPIKRLQPSKARGEGARKPRARPRL